VGKSRRHKHVDRNAHRNAGPGRTTPNRANTSGDRRAKVKVAKLPVAVTADLPPAIPLPAEFEPHALSLAAAPGARSRYPAKKTKRARPSPATRLAEAAVEPETRAAVAPAAAPVLLIGYHPRPPAPAADPEKAMATADEPARFDLDVWADEVLGALVARPVLDTPTPAMVRAAETPLPRRTTVTVWRNNGPVDAIARWVRTQAWRLAVKIAPKSPPKTTEVARLRAENEALRRQLMALQQAPA
jgi:hypothetical protein